MYKDDTPCAYRSRSDIYMSNQHIIHLLAIPQDSLARPADLALQLQDTVQKRLSTWGAAWHIQVNRNDPIASTHDTVAIVVVTTAICTRAHRDHPAWLWHLVIPLPEGWRHFVCECASHNHDITLTRSRTEHNTETILIVARARCMHHLDGAASQTERHRPSRALARPVDDFVERRECVFYW